MVDFGGSAIVTFTIIVVNIHINIPLHLSLTLLLLLLPLPTPLPIHNDHHLIRFINQPPNLLTNFFQIKLFLLLHIVKIRLLNLLLLQQILTRDRRCRVEMVE